MKTENQRDKMLNKKIPILITSLAVPTIISMLVTSIYNLADTYFVSLLKNDSATAAVGNVFSLQTIIQALGFTIGVGAGSIISRSLGKKEDEVAHRTISQALLMGLIVGIIILLSGIFFNKQMMIMFGASNTSLKYAMDYSRWIYIACPFMILSFILNNVLRNEGKARFSMIGLTLGGVLNIILDPICIFKLNMGVSGAGFATMISQIISFLVLISIFIFKKSSSKISIKYLSKEFKSYLEIILIGVPTLFRQGFSAIANTLLSHLCKYYSSDSIMASLTIVSKIYMIIRNIVIGIGQGYQPVLGFNYGAKNYKRIKEGFKFTLLVQTSFCILTTIILLIFNKQLVNIFDGNEETKDLAIKGVKFVCISLPFLGFSTIVNQSLQIMGHKLSATFLASCRQGVLYIPTILILNKLLNKTGLILTQPIADLLTAIVTVFFFRYLMKILKEERI